MELNRDGDGFLINTSDWSEEVMYEMAKSDDMEMTDEIKMYIDKVKKDGCGVVNQEQLGTNELIEEFVMLHLRSEGLDLDLFNER